MKVKIINESKFELPEYETDGSAGMDVRANIDEPITISPLQRVLIPTGLKMAIPKGLEVQVRPRSGLAIKHGITVLNAPGTIDSDYRGNVGVILINLGQEDFTINPGDRIAQIVLATYEQMEFELTDNLDETERGTGGFSSTGIN